MSGARRYLCRAPLALLPLAGLMTGAVGQVLDGEVVLGVGYLDGASDRYGKYSGLRSDGWEALLAFDLEGRPADDARVGRWRLLGERVGLDSRRVQASWIEPGSQRLQLVYQATPRNLFADGQTPFRLTNAEHLSLPPGWSATGASTTELPALQASLTDYRQRQERTKWQLDYRAKVAERWQVDLELGREWRDGNRELAGMIGTNGGNARAALLPVPVDYETDTIELTLRRDGDRHQLGVSYYGSFFSNEARALSWDNPYAAQSQWQPAAGYPQGKGQLAQVPDNQFQQLRLFGQGRLGRATQASIDLAMGRMAQDDDFLPYTVNPALNASVPLPRASLDGRIDTTHAQVRLNHRASPRLHLTAHLRYQDRDNRTDRALFQAVSGDAGAQVDTAAGRINRPYSLTRRDLSLDARYRLPQRTRLQLGYEHRLRQRDFSEVNSSREHVYQLGLTSQRWQRLSLGADLSHARRNAARYQGNRPLLVTRLPGSVDDEAFENHPLLRKYYLADRDRNRLQLRADLHPHDRVYLGVAWAWSEDDYRDDLFGLDESKVRSWLFDAGYTPSESLRWSAFYHRDRYRNTQRARSFTAAPATVNDPDRNWQTDAGDRYDTWGLSVDWEGLRPQLPVLRQADAAGELDLKFELSQARSRSEVEVSAGATLPTAPLPELSTRLQRVRLEARYQVTEASQVRLAWDYERYRTRDFALDGVAVDSVDSVLLFGETSPRYNAHWFTLVLQHRF